MSWKALNEPHPRQPEANEADHVVGDSSSHDVVFHNVSDVGVNDASRADHDGRYGVGFGGAGGDGVHAVATDLGQQASAPAISGQESLSIGAADVSHSSAAD